MNKNSYWNNRNTIAKKKYRMPKSGFGNSIATKSVQRRIRCVDDGKEFNSVADASRDYDISTSLICHSILKETRAKGLKFEYIND